MKISLKWINDFVDISNLDPYLIAEKLTIRTAETEGILAIKDNYSGIMSAHIKEIEKINDEYFKCTVIADKEYTVISGAPNTKKNMNTFFVKPGGMVDGNTIGERKMAGTISQGMLLSGKELGINNDHSGLYELNSDIDPGTYIGDICDFYDHIIEIDNKSLTHRPDLWGIYGFAREIAAIFNLPLKEYTVFDESLINNNTPVDIQILKNDLCYRYIGIRINNIKINMSPINIQTRLMRTEHVPRNIIVDLTNYVMAELGQPMHAFDGNSIESIIVDTMNTKTPYTTLDDVKRNLDKNTLMIMNNDKPIAIAGIMGGSNSEIGSESKTLFLESANFNAVNIRKTSSKLNLRTDSSSRFEKSLDPEFAYTAALRYAYLLKNIQPNIEFSSKLTDVNYNPFKRSIIEIKYDYIYSIIGVEISKKRIKDILESLMFDCECMGEYLIVKAPSFRSTKDIEIPADIIEEISRIYGYENIEPQLPIQRLTIPYNNTERNTENRIRNMLSYDYEMNETDSYIWFDNDFLKLINFVPNNHITLKNSVSLNNTILRTEMLPIMLKNVFENLKYTNAFSLYEMGPVFSGKSETQMLSIITVKEKSKNGDNTSFIQLKNIINDVIHKLTNYNIDLVPLKDKVLLNPSNTSSIEINKHIAGYMGTIHPSFNRLLDKKVNIAFAQIMISSLILKKRTPTFIPYSQFPVSILDFSILKPLDETFESFTNKIESFSSKLITAKKLIAVYEHKELGEFQSVTFRFSLSRNDKSLVAEDINTFSNDFISYIKEKGYNLR